MLTPATATLLISMFHPATRSAAALGLRFSRSWLPWVVAWVAIPLFCLGAPLVGWLLGLYTPDLGELSGFRALVASSTGIQLSFEQARTAAISQLLLLPLAPIVNAPLAFGEELGWRGYLLPRLQSLGALPALLVSGIVWGLWHAPIVLLGYNYPSAPVLGVLFMVGLSTIMGIIIGWLRLASGSIWPAVAAHGALNGSAGVVLLFSSELHPPNAFQVGITGWSGWLLPLVFVAWLLLSGRLSRSATRA